MPDLIGAVTKAGSLYPGYVNASRDGDEVVLTVRADPKVIDGEYVCGYAGRDAGKPGRCTPHDEHCNNYCNMAPEKGPMQDAPKPCQQIIEGDTAVVRFSQAEWQEFLASNT